MEPRYNLPFRTPDTRTQPGYAIVSPQQQFQLHQHHDEQRPPGSLHQYVPAVQYASYYPSFSQPQQSQHNGHSAYAYAAPSEQMHQLPASSSLVQHVEGQLPLPSLILPSQITEKLPCLACTRPDCTLASHRFYTKRTMENEAKQRHKSETTPRPTTAVPVQPMATLYMPGPLQLDAERQHLLSLWSVEWSPKKRGLERHLFPAKWIDRILPAAQKHMPMLQALLAYSGTHWAMANSVISNVASQQQAFAVEMLSQACPTEREASTDEAILTATLFLLIYLAQGNGVEVAKHVSGLVHLTKSRGGPHYLGLGGVVAETLIHADHMQAIFFNHEPIWRLPLPPLQVGLPEKMGRGFQSAVAVGSLDSSLALAARSVCRIADVLVYASSDRPLPNHVKHAFGYLTMMAEYQLARCNATYHASSTIEECVCLALILLNHVVLWDQGATTPNIIQAEDRFWQALHALSAEGLLRSILPCLHMWMVLTGVTVAIREPSRYRVICVENLRAMRMSAGVNTWEQLRKMVLDEFVWIPHAQEETFRGVWLEVEGLKSDVNQLPGRLKTSHTFDVLPPGG